MPPFKCRGRHGWHVRGKSQRMHTKPFQVLTWISQRTGNILVFITSLKVGFLTLRILLKTIMKRVKNTSHMGEPLTLGGWGGGGRSLSNTENQCEPMREGFLKRASPATAVSMKPGSNLSSLRKRIFLLDSLENFLSFFGSLSL